MCVCVLVCAAPVAHTCVRVGVWVCVRRSDVGCLMEVGRHEWRQVGAETMADSVCEDLVVGLNLARPMHRVTGTKFSPTDVYT